MSVSQSRLLFTQQPCSAVRGSQPAQILHAVASSQAGMALKCRCLVWSVCARQAAVRAKDLCVTLWLRVRMLLLRCMSGQSLGSAGTA